MTITDQLEAAPEAAVGKFEPETPADDGRLIAEARGLVKDLFRPRAAIYWADLLATLSVAYPTFYLAHRTDLPLASRVVAFVVSGLAFYRAALFIHELVHLNRSELRGFRIAWNALAGIPLLIPSFLYYTHLDHHRPAHYATSHDGEYLPLAKGPLRGLLLFVGSGLVVPALMVARFLIMTPASWASSKLRALIHRYASAMVIDPAYARPEPTPVQRRVWRLQEVLCLLYLLAVGALLVSGRVHWSWLVQAYALAAFVAVINAVRTLAAHRYRHETDEPHTLVEQLLDSINHPRNALVTEVWAPVGLRFHALHHLLPGVPYHALPEAHRRLMAGLPESSPYRRTNSPGLWASLAQLWRDVNEATVTHSGGNAPQRH
jgi:fatty acid desaturase